MNETESNKSSPKGVYWFVIIGIIIVSTIGKIAYRSHKEQQVKEHFSGSNSTSTIAPKINHDLTHNSLESAASALVTDLQPDETADDAPNISLGDVWSGKYLPDNFALISDLPPTSIIHTVLAEFKNIYKRNGTPILYVAAPTGIMTMIKDLDLELAKTKNATDDSALGTSPQSMSEDFALKSYIVFTHYETGGRRANLDIFKQFKSQFESAIQSTNFRSLFNEEVTSSPAWVEIDSILKNMGAGDIEVGKGVIFESSARISAAVVLMDIGDGSGPRLVTTAYILIDGKIAQLLCYTSLDDQKSIKDISSWITSISELKN